MPNVFFAGIDAMQAAISSGVGQSAALQNIGRSATGNIVKAVLCIRSVKKLGDVKSNGISKTGEKENVKFSLSQDLESAITDISALEKDLMKKAEKSLEKGTGSSTFKDIKEDVEKSGYIALEVQYNPSSLRLDTSAGRQLNYSGDAGNTQVQQVVTPASTTLSFELLFDDMNVQDAYMLEGNPVTSMSTGNLLAAGKSALQGKFSVQRQMEGLLSMLSIPQARHAIFFWGDMSFRGEVTSVSTNYTMFNKKGYPVRGTLGMSIRQGDGTDSAGAVDKLFKYEAEHWDKAFDRIFTEKGKKEGIFSQATNNNLLNLKL